MDKKEYLKKMGQLYAQGIQYGYTPEQVYRFSEESLKAFLQPKKEEFVKARTNYN